MLWRFQNKLKSHRKKCKTRERIMHVCTGWSCWVCGLTSSPSTAAERFISPQRSQYSLNATDLRQVVSLTTGLSGGRLPAFSTHVWTRPCPPSSLPAATCRHLSSERVGGERGKSWLPGVQITPETSAAERLFTVSPSPSALLRLSSTMVLTTFYGK